MTTKRTNKQTKNPQRIYVLLATNGEPCEVFTKRKDAAGAALGTATIVTYDLAVLKPRGRKPAKKVATKTKTGGVTKTTNGLAIHA